MTLYLKSKNVLLLVLAALFPVIAICQNKNVISTQRVFPKVDKVMEFEKALAAHAKKFHKGDVQWHVFSIQSGPDFGGYQITEGPKTWASEDERGDISLEHTNDWNKNVAIYLTDRQSGSYSVYIDSLSTAPLSAFSEKANIVHIYPKTAQGDHVVNIIKKLKKTWISVGFSVAVYSSSSSGPGQYILVYRYKQGLKEREPGFRPAFKAAYEAVNGEGSYAQYLKDIEEYVKESWSELIFLEKELGSN